VKTEDLADARWPVRNREALWTYLATPFILTFDGVRIEETQPWRVGSEQWWTVYLESASSCRLLVQESPAVAEVLQTAAPEAGGSNANQ
jgi:hypothetical protein